MARIVIEEPECVHGYRRIHHRLHAWRHGLVPCGPQRRVLDPGSYVLIEKVDGEWPEWATEHVALWIHPLANDPDGFLDDFVTQALAGGEQP